jgi:hypothetical protein
MLKSVRAVVECQVSRRHFLSHQAREDSKVDL